VFLAAYEAAFFLRESTGSGRALSMVCYPESYSARLSDNLKL
jgi:hypothetical protein